MCIAGVVQPVFLMMHHSRSNQCWPSVRLLLAVFVSCVFLTGAGAAPPTDEGGDARERFVELDGEIQAIKEEILGINRDILLIEEMSLYPHGQQLVVLVSVANNSPVNPDSISLQLDGQTVSQYRYTGSEGAALHEGGVHRLYSGRLSGEHSLAVSVTGKQSKGRTFNEQRSVTIIKRPGRKYLELHLGPGGNTSEPELTVHEW
jgi:hypothetical protein